MISTVKPYGVGRLMLLGLFVACGSQVACEGARGIHYRPDCGYVLTGGASLRLIRPDDDLRTLRLHEVASGEASVVFRDDSTLRGVSLSHSCRRIAYTQYNPESKKLDLHIVSTSGEREMTVKSVFRYQWGQDEDGADLIAYIVQSDREALESLGTWLLNVDTGERTQLLEEGYDLAWAPHDRSYYVWNIFGDGDGASEVQRYNLRSGKLENTPYRGLHFSPEGTYYVSPQGEGEDLKIYLRATNDVAIADIFKLLNTTYLADPVWLNDSTILISSYPPMGIPWKIANLATGQAWEVKEDLVGFADSDGKELLVLIGGSIEKRRFEECATLIIPTEVEDE